MVPAVIPILILLVRMVDRADTSCLCGNSESGEFHATIASCLSSKCTAVEVFKGILGH